MSAADDMVTHNAHRSSVPAGVPGVPARRVAVLTCMDARLDPARVLGLEAGDAHVIRNAGGVATEDAVRSLVISQWLLRTEEVVLVHHTDCGMTTFRNEALKDEIQARTGARPGFDFEAFTDVDADVVNTARRLAASPFLRHTAIRGFVWDVATGSLREVPLAP